MELDEVSQLKTLLHSVHRDIIVNSASDSCVQEAHTVHRRVLVILSALGSVLLDSTVHLALRDPFLVEDIGINIALRALVIHTASYLVTTRCKKSKERDSLRRSCVHLGIIASMG